MPTTKTKRPRARKPKDPGCSTCRTKSPLAGKVVDSRVDDLGETRRRRRECPECAKRVTTRERVQDRLMTVSDRDANVNLYSRSRLLESVLHACGHDAILAARVVTDVERAVLKPGGGVLDGATIAKKVAELLWSHDEVSLVRYLIDQRRVSSPAEILPILAELFPNPPAGGKPPAPPAREV